MFKAVIEFLPGIFRATIKSFKKILQKPKSKQSFFIGKVFGPSQLIPFNQSERKTMDLVVNIEFFKETHTENKEC